MQHNRTVMMDGELTPEQKQVAMALDQNWIHGSLPHDPETQPSQVLPEGIKHHYADLDVLHLYRGADNLDIAETYPKELPAIKDPASLFGFGIGRHGLPTKEQMRNMRAAIRKQMNLDKFDQEMKELLGDDLEEFNEVRDNIQASTQCIVSLIMRYKDNRRLTMEIMKNTSLTELDGFVPNDYLGLTVEKAVEKLDVFMEPVYAKKEEFFAKYPGVADIREKYVATVVPRSFMGRDYMKGGVPRGEMIIAGGINPNVVSQGQRHFLPDGREVFITLENTATDEVVLDPGMKTTDLHGGMEITVDVHREHTPEEIQVLADQMRQPILANKHAVVPGISNEGVVDLLDMAKDAYVDIPETREERRRRLLSENSVSGAVVQPQEKPRFNKIKHEEMFGKDEGIATAKKIKNSSLSGANSNMMAVGFRDQVTFTQEKDTLTAEEAIAILNPMVITGRGFSTDMILQIINRLSEKDREIVRASIFGDLEFTKPFDPDKFARLISPQRIAEENNLAHRSAHELNERLLAGPRPSEGDVVIHLNDSFSAYTPEPTNVSEKLANLPGYSHSPEQLAQDIEEGNVFLSTTGIIGLTPEGHPIPKEDLDQLIHGQMTLTEACRKATAVAEGQVTPEELQNLKDLLKDSEELLEKQLKEKGKALLEDMRLPEGVSIEVEPGATPSKWKATILRYGEVSGIFEITGANVDK